MFIYASMCYIPFSYYDISTIQWTSVSTIAIIEVLYVVLGGSFLAYLCIMTAQRLLRPTVVSMYNYMQPIVATIAAITMGIGSFGWEKGIAIALVFLGVYIVTQSKSRADLEKQKSLISNPQNKYRASFLRLQMKSGYLSTPAVLSLKSSLQSSGYDRNYREVVH